MKGRLARPVADWVGRHTRLQARWVRAVAGALFVVLAARTLARAVRRAIDTSS